MKIKEGGGMDIQTIQEKFEDLLLANPDFDESLLEKDEEGSYSDSDIQHMYSMFEAGTEVGEQWQAAKAQSVPEWISVQDRMPEQGQKVLVFRPDAHNHPHKDPNFKICTYAGADIFINSHFEHVITHWKPLESPIEAQEPAND